MRRGDWHDAPSHVAGAPAFSNPIPPGDESGLGEQSRLGLPKPGSAREEERLEDREAESRDDQQEDAGAPLTGDEPDHDVEHHQDVEQDEVLDPALAGQDALMSADRLEL